MIKPSVRQRLTGRSRAAGLPRGGEWAHRHQPSACGRLWVSGVGVGSDSRASGRVRLGPDRPSSRCPYVPCPFYRTAEQCLRSRSSMPLAHRPARWPSASDRRPAGRPEIPRLLDRTPTALVQLKHIATAGFQTQPGDALLPFAVAGDDAHVIAARRRDRHRDLAPDFEA